MKFRMKRAVVCALAASWLPIAFAEVPAGAMLMETKEQTALLIAKMKVALGEDPAQERGVWSNSLYPDRQQRIDAQIARLPPDQRDRFFDAEFARSLAAFGDIKAKPFCVFSAVPSREPLVYSGRQYFLPNGLFSTTPLRDSPKQPGQLGARGDSAPVPNDVEVQFEANAKPWIGQFDPSRMGAGYEALRTAKTKLGDDARYRTCFSFVRAEHHPEQQRAGGSGRWIVLKWLGSDLIDSRNGESAVAISTSWVPQ